MSVDSKRFRKLPEHIWSIVRLLLIIGISFVIIYPLLVKLSASFMREQDIYDLAVQWIPRKLTTFNYWAAWVTMDYPVAFLNSAFLAVTISLLQLMGSTLIGYGLARYRFPGQSLLFVIVLLMILVPPQVIMIPMFLNFRFFDFFGLLPDGGINLINTVWPMILPAATGTGFKNGLYILIMRQYFKTMPKELEEAAYVDGARPLRTFLQVMLPGTVPILVVVFLFSFVWQWNDYFYTSMYLRDANYLPLKLLGLEHQNTWFLLAYGSGEPDFHFRSLVINAGMVMVITPILLFYAIMQRYFIESIDRTGLVG